MSPLTVDLSLLYMALNLYWFQALDVFVFGDSLTVQGDGLFVYSAKLSKRVAYPFVTDNEYALRAFLAGQGKMEYSDAAKKAHVLPYDWLSSFGYDISSQDVGVLSGRRPHVVFEHAKPEMGLGMLFEERDQQLAILMSHAVLAIAQHRDA